MITQKTFSGTIVLVATNHFGSKHRHELKVDQGVFVGSSCNCGLQLQGGGIAGIQCHITREDGKLWLQEWMSADGTRVNGDPISAKQQIYVGDVIQLGQHEIEVGDAQSLPDVNTEDADEQGPEATRSTEPEAEGSVAEEDPVLEQALAKVAKKIDAPPTDDPEAGDRSNAAADVEDQAETADPQESVDVDLEDDLFDFGGDFDEEETYDRETVALMRAEIEDLQAALAQRDAERFAEPSDQPSSVRHVAEESDQILGRMQELVDEANRSDERVAILEEMLHAAEDANRSEQEERAHLEAWVSDIEKRIGQREDEHVAEVEALRRRLEESNQQSNRLQKQLRQAAQSETAPKQYEETLENLQESNQSLQEELADSQKQCLSLEKRIDQLSDEQERALREERAVIAKEQAKVSRLRFELSSKLTAIEEIPKTENQADKETAHRIQTLRQHLREIHEQEKQDEKEAGLATRLAKLWKRVEY